MHQIASRSYAFEGRCFVIAAGQLLKASDLPVGLPAPKLAADDWIESGGSAIIAPDGRYIAGPVFKEKIILMAELDLTEIDREVMTLDVTGHYSRPDLFDLQIKTGTPRAQSTVDL
jgi:nitrilase